MEWKDLNLIDNNFTMLEKIKLCEFLLQQDKHRHQKELSEYKLKWHKTTHYKNKIEQILAKSQEINEQIKYKQKELFVLTQEFKKLDQLYDE